MSPDAVDPSIGQELFNSPEEAALAGWRSTPRARAQVISVEPGRSADHVYVTIRTDGHPGFHDRDISEFLRASNGMWWETGSYGA